MTASPRPRRTPAGPAARPSAPTLVRETPRPGAPPPTRTRLLLAFAVVYVVWGSTYFGIRVGLETLPPFLMAAARFLVAGALLWGWVAIRERPPRPTRRQWGWAALTGVLMLAGGNGGVVLAEQHVTSGVAALLAASLALWMVLLEWLRPGGERPTALVVAGTLIGLGGVAVLVGPAEIAGARGVDPFGAGAVLVGSLLWAIGSLLSRGDARPASGLQASAMQMLCGGAALSILALLHGDLAAPVAPSARSLLAVGYLVAFGSLLGFTVFIWLMNNARPAMVASYAYVNPVVAVLLGWALGGELVSGRMLGAAALIVVAVVLVTMGRRSGR